MCSEGPVFIRYLGDIMADQLRPLGHDHYYQLVTSPKGDSYVGAVVSHKLADDSTCEGAIWWDERHSPRGEMWTLNSLDPLNVSPSLLCHCGDHGFIQHGKWVPA